MAMTPMGTRTLCKRRPLGRVHFASTSPTGSGRAATSSMAAAMLSSDFASKRSRSSNAALRPSRSARCTSPTFAVRMASCSARICCAIAWRTSFFWAVPKFDQLARGSPGAPTHAEDKIAHRCAYAGQYAPCGAGLKRMHSALCEVA